MVSWKTLYENETKVLNDKIASLKGKMYDIGDELEDKLDDMAIGNKTNPLIVIEHVRPFVSRLKDEALKE